jgi:hypothetical protein
MKWSDQCYSRLLSTSNWKAWFIWQLGTWKYLLQHKTTKKILNFSRSFSIIIREAKLFAHITSLSRHSRKVIVYISLMLEVSHSMTGTFTSLSMQQTSYFGFTYSELKCINFLWHTPFNHLTCSLTSITCPFRYYEYITAFHVT